MQQDGDALYYAAEALQADSEVVLAAVQQKGEALQFAAVALQADKWLQLLARRVSLPARTRAFIKLARDRADAAVQSKVNLFLIKRGLDDWISAKKAKAHWSLDNKRYKSN